jgi:hypothetical protein
VLASALATEQANQDRKLSPRIYAFSKEAFQGIPVKRLGNVQDPKEDARNLLHC